MKYILALLITLFVLSCNDDSNTTKPIDKDTTKVDTNLPCGKIPVDLIDNNTSPDSLRIIAIMPNPAGSDDKSEYFIVRNFGKSPLSLINFYIKDKDGTKWDFPDVTLNQCDTLKLVSDKSAQLLNSSDEVTLFNMFNIGIQTVTYTDAEDGKEIRYDK